MCLEDNIYNISHYENIEKEFKITRELRSSDNSWFRKIFFPTPNQGLFECFFPKCNKKFSLYSKWNSHNFYHVKINFCFILVLLSFKLI